MGAPCYTLRAGHFPSIHYTTHRCILHRLLHLGLDVLVALLFVVACFSPSGHGLAVPDEDMEKGVEEEHDIGCDRDTVEEGRLCLLLRLVRHESGLDHDECVVAVLRAQHVAVCVGGWVGGKGVGKSDPSST